MKPVVFPEANTTFAVDQPEYIPLPACVTTEGMVVSCWELTPEELAILQTTGKLWIKQLTYGNPLQALLPQVETPFHDS